MLDQKTDLSIVCIQTLRARWARWRLHDGLVVSNQFWYTLITCSFTMQIIRRKHICQKYGPSVISILILLCFCYRVTEYAVNIA